MDQEKIFCGSGKSYGQYGNVGLTLCLSDIPKEHMSKDQNGKTWVRLNVCPKRQPNEKSTHYVEVNTWKPGNNQQRNNQGYQNQGYQQQTPESFNNQVQDKLDSGDIPF